MGQKYDNEFKDLANRIRFILLIGCYICLVNKYGEWN